MIFSGVEDGGVRVKVKGMGAISTISTPARSGSPTPVTAHASTPFFW